MKLIEKKCPNCGAGLEFGENDKSCKCSYCHRSFEIERDKDSLDNYNLTMAKVSDVVPAKTFLIPICIILGVGIILFFIAIFGIRAAVGGDYLKDINKISNEDYSTIDHDAKMAIFNLTFGDNEYNISGNESRVKEYLAYNKDGNIYIPVYKVVYSKIFDSKEKVTVYIPVKYVNLKSNIEGVDIFDLGDGNIDADDYYFNMEHSSATKGYSSIEDVYDKYIKPLEKDYTIVEK